MAILRAHAMPVAIVFLDAVLDHTYVTCGGGHAWPCWGRSEGGPVLQTGEGSSARAESISRPDSHAGIVYGITGLCHQTANRVLYPAGITVSDAVGYGITEFFFGSYGSIASEWLEHRMQSAGQQGEIPECQAPESPERLLLDEAQGQLVREIDAVYESRAGEKMTDPDPELLYRLLELRVGYNFGIDQQRGLVDTLQNIQSDALSAKAELDGRLRRREISGRAFAAEANELFNEYLSHCQDSIGERAYVGLFDMAPRARIAVIRPDICEVVYDGGDPERLG